MDRRTGTKVPGKEQQTFRVSKELGQAMAAACRRDSMEKGELMEVLLRRVLELPPSPDQETLARGFLDCQKRYLGSYSRSAKALSILMGENIAATRLRPWIQERRIPQWVAPYLMKLIAVCEIVGK